MTETATPAPGRPPAYGASSWLWMIPGALVIGWWIYDLSFQWASLVEYRFGWIVVMLTGFLVWERWPSRPKDDSPASTAVCLALGLAALPLVLVAELYKTGVARVPSSSMLLSLGCALFVVANILLLAGPKTVRHFIFPLAFFFIAVPLPSSIWNPIVFSLQHVVAVLNVEVLKTLGIPAHREGHLIRLPNTVVGVDEACSGVRSLQSSIMAALFVGDLMLKRAGWKVFFLFAGIFLAVVGNFFRSLYLSLTAHRGGAGALEAVHDTAGWSVLLFTFIGVSVLAWLVMRIESRANRFAAPRVRAQAPVPRDEAP